jgi:glycerophosphoryl diester phosphodiesterase
MRIAGLAALGLAVASACALDLQGHRGARGLAPENTLVAFAKALTIGVTTLELDVVMTRDDVLVISHDTALNPDITRGPDGRFLAARGPAIRQLTFDELQRYDVGRLDPARPYAAQHPQQRSADGARIPRLIDLFALIRKAGNNMVRVSIETKITPLRPDDTPAPEPFAQALVGAIRAAGLEHRASIQSFDWRTLQVVQREAPEIETVYLTAQRQWLDNIGAARSEPSAWTAGIAWRDHGSVPKMIRAAGGKTWSSYYGDLDADIVREAHALGLQVLAWTVNAPQDMEHMIDLGVDGLITDRPDVAREVMQRRGLALPKGTPVEP